MNGDPLYHHGMTNSIPTWISSDLHDLGLDEVTAVRCVAISHLVKGIVGEFVVGLACATCHCYVDEAWLDRVSPPSDAEKEMLEGVAGELQAGSRLSCQLTIGPALDGLVVRLPKSQF